MTNEASAVVAGIFDADSTAEVTVADVHGPYRNMIPELLDERATLLRGKPRHFGMMDGIDDGGYDVAMFYRRARQSRQRRFRPQPHVYRIDSRCRCERSIVGRTRFEFSDGRSLRVPVVLVAGDQASSRKRPGSSVSVCRLFRSKRVARTWRQKSSPQFGVPVASRSGLRTASRSPGIAPLAVESPVSVEVTLNRPVLADLVAMLDDVERIDGRTIRLHAMISRTFIAFCA
ncbi:MAG: M55 family metallopeptidase [Thermomicrobiales bacterium]